MKAQELVDIVNSSNSLVEATQRSGLTYSYLMWRCNALRKKGFIIKNFPMVRQDGINSWLRRNHPDIHKEWQQYKKDNNIVP